MIAKINDLPDVPTRPADRVNEGQEPADHVVGGNGKAEAPKNASKQTTSVRSAKIKHFKPFPVDALPEPIREFVVAGAAAIGCDTSYIALPTLAALASAIGNSRRLKLGGNWSAPPNLWIAIVGDSGSRKTPALRSALEPIFKRDDEAARQNEKADEEHDEDLLWYKKSLAEWKRDRETQSPPPEKPEPPQANSLW